MNNESNLNLTLKEICNYIAAMNRLIEEGIIKFDKEKAYVEFCYDECINYLEKQNIELQQEIHQLKNDNAVMKAGLIKISDEELKLYKNVFEEIRNYIRNYPYQDLIPIELLVVKNILDQVKESDKQ